MLQHYNPANADLLVNINGRLVHRDEAGVSRIPSAVRDIPKDEIHRADEVFCTGTMGEIASVTRIDDTVFGDGAPGPVTSRLSDLYSQVTANEGTLMV